MNWRQAILDTFEKRRPERIVWQPRLDHWYHTNRREGTLPERYRDADLLDVYRDLDCSWRPYALFNGCFVWDFDDTVRVEEKRRPERVETYWHTPEGTLRRVEIITESAHQTHEFPVKTVADLPALEHLLEHRFVRFDAERFAEADRLLGDLGAPTTWRRAQPIQLFFIEYMGFEPTILALHDSPREMERTFRVIEETGWQHFDAIAESPIRIVNFGDNVDCHMLSPVHFERYALEYYRRMCDRLHEAGKFVHPHWDGALRTLLPYMGSCGFDAIEALTPLPQGDVGIETLREAMPEGLILIDGLPATHFLPQTTYQELEAFTRKVLDLFAPNLILGISDELPPGGDIEKVRLVSEIVAGYTP